MSPVRPSRLAHAIPVAMLAIVLAFLLPACVTDKPENIEISVQAPTAVQPGQRFEIRAMATNTADRKQQLVSLDIADAYLEGIAIESSDPPFKEAFHVPFDNTMSYVFELPIAPGSGREVVFQAYAAHAGDHSGEVDFCINTEYTFVSHPLRTIVE